MVHRYTRELNRLIKDSQYQKYKIYHYSSSGFEQTKMMNSAFLMGAFMIIIQKMTAE
jgi:hypothetical protein